MITIILTILAQTYASPFVCVDGPQVIGNEKVFTGLVQAYGDYGPDHVSIYVINGLRVGGVIAPALDGNSVVLMGRRETYDSAAGIIITNEHTLDAGGYISVKQGETGTQLFVVDYKGNVHLGCASGADPYTCGSIIDATGKSGHPAVRAGPGGYLLVEGNLGTVCALLPDGGEPDPDGGTGYLSEHVTCDGGHCCFPYAGSHGNFTDIARTGMQAGWVREDRNGTQSVHVVTHSGAFGNPCTLTRDKFPRCPDTYNIATDRGQFNAFGAFPGALQCAVDTEAYYVCMSDGWHELLMGVGEP
jgi:hypothetical protein